MGSLVMHSCVAKLLQEKYNFSNDFLTGEIAPDVLKNLSNRDETHYIKEIIKNGYMQRLPDIESFIKEKDGVFDDYSYGYLSHLVQDKVWFSKYVQTFAFILNPDKVVFRSDEKEYPVEVFSKKMHSDYRVINKIFSEKYNINIIKILEDSKGYFSDLKISNELDKYIQMHYKTAEGEDMNFLTMELVEKYIEECFKVSCEYIDRFFKIK